ncbi:MAG: CRISPR system Cascade subunit CasD [Verrucomicrobia bacterium]|nr:MAG: CRISPR system Cascade subunit CasD [Verrucomicrobiota bacterium]
MQSWGSSSRFNRRETEAFPTKSALIGLLAAAAGIDKYASDEAERLVPLAALRLSVFRLPRAHGRLVGRLSDFHTVGGGYDAKSSAFDKMSIPRKASGGASANAVITQRTYLNEARFIAAFEGDADTVAITTRYLEDPVWGVWFGRKACLPAMPLSPVTGEDRHAAANVLISRIRIWEESARGLSFPPTLDPSQLERWEEPAADQLQPGDFHLHDQPVAFGQREFHSRPIRRSAASDP